MVGRPSGRLAAFRRKAVKRSRKAKVSIPTIANALGISQRWVRQLDKKPGLESESTHATRFVSKALGYTKATEAQIAERAGITKRQVGRIKKRDSIKRKYRLKTGPTGFDTKRKLTTVQHAEIVKLSTEQKLSQYVLADMYKVTQPHINYILKKAKGK